MFVHPEDCQLLSLPCLNEEVMPAEVMLVQERSDHALRIWVFILLEELEYNKAFLGRGLVLYSNSSSSAWIYEE